MSDNIKKDRIVGMSEVPSSINYEQLKKGLESNKPKSAFSNFFDTLKKEEPPKQSQ